MYNFCTIKTGKSFQYYQRDHIGPGVIPSGQIGDISDSAGGGNAKRFSFTDSDLTNYSVVLNHNIKQYNVVEVYDNNDNIVIPTEVYAVDDKNIRINLSGIAPITGTYRAVVVG